MGGAVSVLRLEKLADRRRKRLWIAQDFAPILRADPGILVFEDDAVELAARR